MLIHKPWTVWQAVMHAPGLLVVAVGMLGLTVYAALLAIKDQFVPRESEHDRFADRAVYSCRRSVDPLSKGHSLKPDADKSHEHAENRAVA